MEIQIREAGEVSVLDFIGNLDTNTSPKADKEISRLIEDGNHRILFNLKEVNFVSSAGLRVLLGTAKKLRTSGGKMMVCGLNDVVQEVFDISGFASTTSCRKSSISPALLRFSIWLRTKRKHCLHSERNFS
jgi:anti-anti-sigma factor